MRKFQVKYLFIVLYSFIILSVKAQTDLRIDFGKVDSSEVERHRQLEYYQFVTGSFGSDYLLGDIELPQFNAEQEYHERYTINMELLPLNNFVFTGISSGPFGAHSPFYHNGQILSQQAFQVSDKLIIGGFSYGANSLYTAPFPNQNSSYFDTYGSTMFLQYKVSKNIKIETRVSVGQNQGHAPGF